MHVGNNILARKILPLDGSSYKIEGVSFFKLRRQII